VFLAVQILTPLFSLTVPNFVMFFRLLKSQFNEDSKNVLETVIFSLQVSLASDFVTVLSNCVSDNSNFDTAFLPECIKFCRVFSGCWIEN